MKPTQKQAILKLSRLLVDKQYALRGTASAVLQGYNMKVADIDVVCDEKTALACNRLLNKFLVEKVKYRASEKFKSWFGKFEINHELIEIMGEWEIRNTKGRWVGPFNASERIEISLEKNAVFVTSIETELKTMAAMGRWNAFWKLKRQVEAK